MAVAAFKNTPPADLRRLDQAKNKMRFTGERFNITESMAIGQEKDKWYLLHDGDGFTKIGVVLSPSGSKGKGAFWFSDVTAAKEFAKERNAFLVFPGNDGSVNSGYGVYVVRLFNERSVFEKYGPGVAFEPGHISIRRIPPEVLSIFRQAPL